MNIQKILMIGVVVMSVAGTRAGELLSAETVLPLQSNKDAFKPTAAFLGGSYLVVWKSGILAPGDMREGFKYNSDIVACKVGKNGEVLSKEPFVISKAKGLQDMPQLTASRLRPEGKGTSPGKDQDVALVVWQDLRNGKDWDTYGARIDASGKVLDPDGFLIAGGAHNQAKPRVAWDGKTFVVVWMDFRNGKNYEVYAARVQADGQVIDPQGIQLSKQGNIDPAICSAGDGKCYVLWCGGGGHYAPGGDSSMSAGFLEDGKYTSVLPFTDPFDFRRNTPYFVGAGKDCYLFAWRNEHWNGRAQGVPDGSATVCGKDGLKKKTLQLEGAPHLIFCADIAWDGSAFVAAWAEYRWQGKYEYKYAQGVAKEGVLASRISSEGNLIGPALVVSDVPKVPSTNPCVSSDGAGTTLIAYEKQPETGDVPIKIAFRMLTAAGTVSAGVEAQVKE